MLCNYTVHHIKISSLGLMIKHEQFNLNHSTKHIFSQKIYFENTVSGIVKPSVTIPEKLQINGSLSEPAIHDHFRPQSNQHMMVHLNQPKQPVTPLNFLDCHGWYEKFQKFLTIRSQVLGSIKRPLTASFKSNIRKILKMRIKPK